MNATSNSTQQDPRCRYRLELEGEIGEDWAAWFGAERIRSAEGRTVVELRVPDQAALYGILRRVDDLHLRLFALTRIEGSET